MFFNRSQVAMKIMVAASIFHPHITLADTAQTQEIEHIEVTAKIDQLLNTFVAYDQVQSADLSQWLPTMPGANVNMNGPLTGIAQYRGLFGDRLLVNIDGQPVIGAGPNAMDTPLSYAANVTSESLTLYRGIAPVSAGIETLAGAIDVTTKAAQFSDHNTAALSGKILGSFSDINDGSKMSSYVNVANDNLAVLGYFDNYQGNDIEAADGRKITPTGYDKTQTGLDTRWQINSNHLIGMTYDYTDTHNAGTPALPMDITYIYTHRAALEGQHELNASQFDWKIGYTDADHEMDNFSERYNATPSAYRTNNADSESYYYAISWQFKQWLIGADGFFADHNATITNPNNPMFNVENFNNVTENKHSVFAQYEYTNAHQALNTGVRVKYVEADAGEVSHHMAMMNPAVGQLVNEFNQSDRSQSTTDFDLVIEYKNQINPHTLISLAVARKQRAPSYQERYLWIPMEATGGLADGNTYLGDIDLASETALQTNLGLTYQANGLQILFDAFYQRIDDYIQGVPSTNMQANMISSMMMNNDNVLQFANVEASLRGYESHMTYQLNQHWQSVFQVSYVRGKREDIQDNLYRIAPLNGFVGLNYQADRWAADIKLHFASEQDKVSATNKELVTSGYGFVNVQLAYMPSNNLSIKAGIDNLFDKAYQNHLAGYNRVQASEIDVMERIPSTARDVWIAMSYQF